MAVSERRGGQGGDSTSLSGVGGAHAAPRTGGTHHALLPLRLFLGFTFLYAGLDKLTDSAFLSGSGPGSLVTTLEAVRDTAAAPWLIDLALNSPQNFGLFIAGSEIAVGLGTIFGLWARLAALGGALISLTFWLTISWQTTPYYYGNDLPYLVAWLPLVMAGAPRYSLDHLLEVRRRRRGRQIFG